MFHDASSPKLTANAFGEVDSTACFAFFYSAAVQRNSSDERCRQLTAKRRQKRATTFRNTVALVSCCRRYYTATGDTMTDVRQQTASISACTSDDSLGKSIVAVIAQLFSGPHTAGRTHSRLVMMS